MARFGVAIVVDCHSMPSALAAPDIVLGDRYGASAPPSLTGWAENAFAGAGFSVVRNSPYAGGYTTALYGRGAGGMPCAADRDQPQPLSGRRKHGAAPGLRCRAKAADRGSGQTDRDAAVTRCARRGPPLAAE